MTADRFSKKTLAKYVFGRMDALQAAHKFTTYDGWAQVEGKATPVIVAYGEYYALKQMASEFELDRT